MFLLIHLRPEVPHDHPVRVPRRRPGRHFQAGDAAPQRAGPPVVVLLVVVIVVWGGRVPPFVGFGHRLAADEEEPPLGVVAREYVNDGVAAYSLFNI